MIDAEIVRNLLDYDRETGVFRWRVSIGRGPSANLAGQIAGHARPRYWGLKIAGRPYEAHRVAWLHVHGVWPTGHIDHINGDGFDNRIANLRDASRSQNARNSGVPKTNTSGFKGVYPRGRSERWQSRIRVNGVSLTIGTFTTNVEAAAAYDAAAIRYFGEFARTNKSLGLL